MKRSELAWLGLNALLWTAVGAAGSSVFLRDQGDHASVVAQTRATLNHLQELGLDADQQVRIAAILEHHERKVGDLYAVFADGVASLERTADGEIAGVLSTDQLRRAGLSATQPESAPTDDTESP